MICRAAIIYKKNLPLPRRQPRPRRGSGAMDISDSNK